LTGAHFKFNDACKILSGVAK